MNNSLDVSLCRSTRLHLKKVTIRSLKYQICVQQYKSLVGAMQWAISIGLFDIITAVMTLSSFRALPCQGHMDRVKRI
jgi:hypothetical protein